MTGTDCCILIFSKFLAIINVRSDIKEQACLHQKALLLRIGGLFFALLRLQRWGQKATASTIG